MKRNATSLFTKWCMLLAACMTLSAGTLQAQSILSFSNSPDFNAEVREFDEGDTIYMKVEAADVDFSSVRVSQYQLFPRNGEIPHEGEFLNNFDGTYTAELAISDLDLVDHLWNMEVLIEDASSNSFQTRVQIKIGDVAAFPGFEIRAVVEEVETNSFVLKGYDFLVDDQTVFEFPPYYVDPNEIPEDGTAPPPANPEPVPATFADVQEGFMVRVSVEPTGNNELKARRVEINGPPYVPGDVNLSGRVQSIDQEKRSLLVRDRVVFVSEDTQLSNGELLGDREIPDWLVGRLMSLYGEFQDDDSILAHFVHVAEGVREELEVRGVVDNVEDDDITVQGFKFKVLPTTTIERFGEEDKSDGEGDGGDGGDDGSGDPPGKASLNEINPGLVVRVFGVINKDGVQVAERISIESGVDNGIRLSGPIAELTEAGFQINGWAVEFAEHTSVFNENFEQVTPADLIEGQLVLVFGEFDQENTIKAHHIEYRRKERDEFAMFGPITEVGDNTITVWDVEFAIGDNTKIEGEPGSSLSLEDLSVGQLVNVISLPDAAGVFTAEYIHLPHNAGDFVRVSGRLENFSDQGFDLLGRSILFKPETQFRGRNYEPAELADFENGAAVQVFGNFDFEGAIVAHEVMLSGADREEIELWGVIEAVNGDLVLVSGIDFIYAGDSKIYLEGPEGGRDGSLEDLKQGMPVTIMGVIEDGATFIEHIFVPEPQGEHVRITGEVTNASSTGMVLWGNEVMYHEFTEFRGEDFQPVSPEEVVDGLDVDVFGTYDEFGAIQADVVEIRGNSAKEEFSLTGSIEEYDGVNVVVAGTAFMLTDQTQIFDNSEGDPGNGDGINPGKYSGIRLTGESAGKFAGKRSGFDDLKEGLQIEIVGFLNPDGIYEAQVIHIYQEENFIRLGGPVENLDPGVGSLSVQGYTIAVGPETFIQNENFEQIDLGSLQDGQFVEVGGELLEDGAIVAHNVEIRPGGEAFIALDGEIGSLQGDLVVVHGIAFTVSEFTQINSETGEQLTPEDLMEGARVHISGNRGDDGVLTAFNIFVKGNQVWAWMNGAIQSLGDLGFEIQGRVITVDEGTNIVNDNYEQITVEDLEIGQQVFVSGELREEGDLKAFNVETKGQSYSELEVAGLITNIDGELLEVNGRPYQTNENTFVTNFDGTDVPLDELLTGMRVRLVVIPDDVLGKLVAKIHVENAEQDAAGLRMRGAIQEIAGDGFVLQGRLVLVDEETQVVGDNYEPIPLESLEAGQFVTVFGRIDLEGSVVAEKVESQKQQLEELETRGVIAEVNGEQFFIRDLEFFVDEKSQVTDDKGFPVSIDLLTPGTIANVTGAPVEGGGFRVVWMHVGAGDGDRFVSISGDATELNYADRTFMVQGYPVKADEFAEVVGANYEFIPFSDLEEGGSVRVHGQYNEDGSVYAHRIEVRSGEGQEIEFRARIEEIGDETLVARGLTFVIGEQTWIGDSEGQNIPLDKLVPGQIISISGTPDDAGTYRANWINVSNGNEDRGIGVSGRLVEVDPDERVLVIRDHVIEMNPEAEIVGDNYERISFDELKEGRQVSLWGWLHEDGRIEGHRAELRLPNKEDFSITGVVSEIDGRFVYINGVKVVVPEDAFIGSPDIGRLDFDRIFTGLVVHVEGGTGENGALVGRKVQVYGLDESQTAHFIGPISNLDNGSFDIGTIGMSLSDNAFVLDGNDQPIAPTAVQDGFNVAAVTFGDGSDLQVRLMHVFDIVRDERSVLGRIESLGTSSFTIREFTFEVTEETVILDPLGDPMEFADLVERMRLEVHAIADASGTLVAREIQAKPRDRKLTGTVAEITGDYLVVAGLTITIDPMTVFRDPDGVEISQTGIVAGQTVNLTMTLGPGGRPLATEVNLLPRIEDEVVLTGTVEAAIENLLVVLGRRFQIIPNTKIFDENGAEVEVTSFSVGDVVKVRALLLAGDNLVALRVNKQDAESADIRVEGPIVTVSASTLEVMGIFFFINESTSFIDINRNEATVDDFAEGQTVFVVGEGQANGTVVATRVQVQNVSLTAGESTGISDAGEFSMFGNDYRVDENTMVLGNNNVQLTLEDVEAGQFLEVRGTGDAEGGVAGKTNSGASILVSKIKIIDAEGSGEYELEVDPDEVTNTEDEELPKDYALFQNYPNPFNPITTIRFTLPQSSPVILKVYDVTGREIQTLVSSTMVAGTHEIQWNGRNSANQQVASGVYLYRLQAGKHVITRRMVMLK